MSDAVDEHAMQEAAAMIEDEAAARGDDRVAAAVLGHYGMPAAATCTLINLSENATYRVEDSTTGQSAILRVHRVDYHDRPAIESELDWLTALGEDTDLITPAVVPTLDGHRVVSVDVDGVERHAVMFSLVPGTAPDESPETFAALGAINAQLHQHARTWRPPPGFTRFSWDWPNSLGATARWGRWQDGFNVGTAEQAVLAPAADLVRSRLLEHGTTPDRFGLIHADLRAANLLVDRDQQPRRGAAELAAGPDVDAQIAVIDFDDCGPGWFGYDFAAAVSFLEHDPRLPDWQAAWLHGYRGVAPFDPAEEAMLPTFIMLRRLMLVAWLGSHAHSREAQDIGPGYTAGSCALAEAYLASGARSLT